MRNLEYNLTVRKSFGPAVVVATPAAGIGVDTAGYETVLALLSCGVQAGTTDTFVIQECDTDTDGSYTDVADANLVGGTNSFVIISTNDNKNYIRQYIGGKRWVRWKFSAGTSGSMPVGGSFILSNKRHGVSASTEEATS